MAKTSMPTSSTCLAIVTMSRMRWASLGVSPVVGSRVMSLTLKMPNCIWLMGFRPLLFFHAFALIPGETEEPPGVFPPSSARPAAPLAWNHGDRRTHPQHLREHRLGGRHRARRLLGGLVRTVPGVRPGLRGLEREAPRHHLREGRHGCRA